MSLKAFKDHLYRCVWAYVIKHREYSHKYNKDYGNIYEPEDFYPSAVNKLFEELNYNGSFYGDCKKFIPHLDTALRKILLDFMPWYRRLTQLPIEERYSELVATTYSGDEELKQLIEYVEKETIEYEDSAGIEITTKHLLDNTFNNFTSASQVLKIRRKEKCAIHIKDEYDVQDILFTLLKPHFPEIRREEVVQGRSDTRFLKIDFMLPKVKLGIECKFIRDKKHAKDISKELDIDIQTYHKHQDCNHLIFFLYDPQLAIKNPAILVAEYDNIQTFNGKSLRIDVVIRPMN